MNVAGAGWRPRTKFHFALANFFGQIRDEQRCHERQREQYA
jgi:hypothetical protein